MVPKISMAFKHEVKLNEQGKKYNEGFSLNFEKVDDGEIYQRNIVNLYRVL